MDWGKDRIVGDPWVDSGFYKATNERLGDQAQRDADRGMEWFVIEFNAVRNRIAEASDGLG